MFNASRFSPAVLFTVSSVVALALGAFETGPSAWARTDASQLDATLLFNQKFFGLISNANDEDVVGLDLGGRVHLDGLAGARDHDALVGA